MSLINDALKRAKVQQQSSPDAPRMQFRPVEAARPPVKKNHTVIWIAVVIMAGLIIGFVFRQLTRENKNAAPKEVKAREIVPAKPIPQETAPTAQAPAAATTASTPNSARHESPSQDVAAVPIIRQEEPRIVPKLQAVVFDLKHPSAIINGRSVFVGDRVNDLRVVAISQESVTLAGNGQTNVLVLGE
jgi:type IV secretory pathway VirB10-like protein